MSNQGLEKSGHCQEQEQLSGAGSLPRSFVNLLLQAAPEPLLLCYNPPLLKGSA